MLKKFNDYIFFLILLLIFWGGSAYAKVVSFAHQDPIIVLEKDRAFSEQLSRKTTTYIIRDNFDLRENISGLIIDNAININNKKYYKNRMPIVLKAGQGIWVPSEVDIMTESFDSLLSKNGFYLSHKGEKVYLRSTKNRSIDYKISGVITMPEDCVLQFEGGKLSNGIIRSVGTQIQAPPIQIFGDNMYFDWYWDLTDAYPEWFGAKGDKLYDDGVAIQKCLDSFKKARLVNHQYYSSIPICIPAHGSLIGSGKYQTTISYTKSMECMISSDAGITSTELVISNVNLNKDNPKTSINRGINIYSTTGSRIESVFVSGVNVGYALNSYFGCQIKGCVAYDCKTGFYLGVDGGSSTTVDYDNCYANKCGTGHLFRNCNYITTKNTSADYCETAYDFVESVVTLMSPGAECCKYFIKVIPHPEISNISNYAHNNIHVINGQSIYNEHNKEGVIYITTGTRGYEDRNRIVIDGFNIYFNKDSKKNRLLNKDGDAILHLNNLSSHVQPDIEAVNYYRDGVGAIQKSSSLQYWTDRVVGTSVFIKELNKPVFWDGTNWVDANGVVIVY